MSARTRHFILGLFLSTLPLALPVSGDAQGRGESRDAQAPRGRGDGPDAPTAQPRGDGQDAPTARPRGEGRDAPTAQPGTEDRGAPPAQRRGDTRPAPVRPGRVGSVRGQFVFIGGYFYDPFFGPYPWWGPAAYPYWYFPVYDNRASVRVLAKPKEAAVYVDGFYAGIADDFDGVFQALPLASGGHQIALFLEGYRTVHHNLYLRPGSTLKLRESLEQLPPGVNAEPPPVAPPIPPPPAGSYRAPRTPPRFPVPPPFQAPAEAAQAVGFGTLDLRVQPADADVTIDGERWRSSEPGHFVVQVSGGPHRVEVSLQGRPQFSSTIQVREGETTPLNVSLSPAGR